MMSGLGAAQVPPRADPVNPTLAPDAANDFFQRGKNLYDSAQAAGPQDTKIDLYQRAAQVLTEYLNSFPNHPNAEMAWWYLGNSYYQSGQIDDGKRCFSTLLNRYGKGKYAAAAAFALAREHYNKGEYAFAAPLFERVAENAGKPEDRAQGNYFAGNCYRQLGRDREAAISFRKVVEDPAGGPYIGQSKVALAHVARNAGKLEEALAQFEEIVAGGYAAKVRGEAALYASLAAAKLNRPELADKYLKLVLTTEGMEEFRPDAQTSLMENFLAKKDYQQVVDIYRRSAAKSPDPEKEAIRLMLAGRAYMGLNQPTEALGLFREIERLLKPENELVYNAAYYRLLCFFQIEGRHVPEQVDAFLQLYRKTHPDDQLIQTALMMKAETLYSNKDIAAAAKVYSEINAGAVSEKNRAGLLFQRGWCLSEAGDAQGAIRSLSDFIEKYPKDERVPSAVAKRAKAYVESAEPAKAIADFDRLTGAQAPEDLASFAWLESARLRRSEQNFADMITRYQGLLKNIKGLSDNLQGEANYWIGWGLWKNNAAKDAIPYLEKARTLRPEDYRKHAGLILALCYFAQQNPQKLADEIKLGIEGKYADDIPNQAIQWSGMQSYNAGDYESAARTLDLVANPKEPRETPKEAWRYLAKARLETGDAEGALTAVNNVLEMEDNSAWKADGLLDRGRALLMLGRATESRKAADEALALHPQGHTNAGLFILTGDLEMKAGDAKTAAGKYQYVVQFHDDKELKPQALWKLVKAFEKQGDAAEAAKYSKQLKDEFPNWIAPAKP